MIKSRFRVSLAGAVVVLGFSVSTCMAEIKVITSIKPVHSLVAAVMAGAGKPGVIIKGGGSPHTYNMRPSDAKALQNAKVVIWIGGRLEKFLHKPLGSIASKAQILELLKARGVVFHSLREGGAWEKHGHGKHGHKKDHHGKDQHDGKHHAEKKHKSGHGHAEEKHSKDHGKGHDKHKKDSHIWLDPHNARAFVAAIVDVLSKADPANASLFKRNGDRTIARLRTLEKALDDQLKPVRGRGFIVFHDSSQYFEKRFNLTGVGSISLGDARAPGARRLREMRKKVASAKAICVFSEPQFKPRLVQTIIEGTKARTGELDPLGANIANGPDLYFTMMRNNANVIEKCLRR